MLALTLPVPLILAPVGVNDPALANNPRVVTWSDPTGGRMIGVRTEPRSS